VRPTKPDNREFCGKCHAEGSDNKGVPTVDMATHGEKYVCWQCHYPHMLGGI
jgi:ribosomal protein S27AE